MSETKPPKPEMKDVMDETNKGRSRIVFRNHRDAIYYLRRRSHQPETEPNFVLGPGATVEALDDQEEKLLLSLGLIDVAKETPALGNQLEDVKRQLETERAKNAQLLAEKSELEKKVQTVDDQVKRGKK